MSKKRKGIIIIGMFAILALSIVFQYKTQKLIQFEYMTIMGWQEVQASDYNKIPTTWQNGVVPNKDKVLWLKVDATPSQKGNTALMLRTMDVGYEMYSATGEMISTNIHKGKVRNYYNIIEINKSSPFFYFKLKSDYPLTDYMPMGMLGGQWGNANEMFLNYFLHDLDTFILVLVFIFIGIGIILFSIFSRKSERPLFYLGLFSIASGINVLNYVEDMKYVITLGGYWKYNFFGYMCMPIILLLFVKNILYVGEKQKDKKVILYYALIALNCMLIVYVLFMDLLKIKSIVFLGFYNAVPFALVLILIIVDMVKSTHEVSITSDFLFTAGGIAASISGLWDIVSSSVFNNGSIFVSEYGMMIFVVCILLTFVNQYLNTQKKLLSYNADLESMVTKKTQDIRQLLDNSGEGFLTIMTNGIILEEYSGECLRLFGKRIEGLNIASLFLESCCNDDSEEVGMMIDVLNKIEITNGIERQKMLTEFLPTELWVRDFYVLLSYKLYYQDQSPRIMIIIQDQTSKKELESELNREKVRMEMALNIALYYNDFYDLYCSYRDFCYNGISELLGMSDAVTSINRIFMEVHSYKGDFSQFGLEDTSIALHELESEIEDMAMNANAEQVWTDILNEDRLMSFIASDLAVLTEYFGEDFMEQEKNLRIPYQQILELEDKAVKELTDPSDFVVIESIRSLKYRNFKELFKFYPKYLNQLANRYERMVAPLEISGDDILVDIEVYHTLSKLLLHLLRNCIAHGIESVDERLECEKSMEGHVSFVIGRTTSHISIQIEDDGKGIQKELLIEKARDLGKSDAQLLELSDEEIHQLIFMEGISTAAEISLNAGRGMGLSAVKHGIEQMGGSIQVESKVGEGTRFVVRVPYDFQ